MGALGEGGVGWLPLALGEKWWQPKEGRMKASTKTASRKRRGENRLASRVAGAEAGRVRRASFMSLTWVTELPFAWPYKLF